MGPGVEATPAAFFNAYDLHVSLAPRPSDLPFLSGGDSGNETICMFVERSRVHF